MTKRNPFLVIEKIGKKVGDILLYTLTGIVLLGLLALSIYLPYTEGWGWWSLTGPLIFVGIIVVMGLGIGGWYWVTDKISVAWNRAKYRWEDEHREREENEPNV